MSGIENRTIYSLVDFSILYSYKFRVRSRVYTVCYEIKEAHKER